MFSGSGFFSQQWIWVLIVCGIVLPPSFSVAGGVLQRTLMTPAPRTIAPPCPEEEDNPLSTVRITDPCAAQAPTPQTKPLSVLQEWVTEFEKSHSRNLRLFHSRFSQDWNTLLSWLKEDPLIEAQKRKLQALFSKLSQQLWQNPQAALLSPPAPDNLDEQSTHPLPHFTLFLLKVGLLLEAEQAVRLSSESSQNSFFHQQRLRGNGWHQENHSPLLSVPPAHSPEATQAEYLQSIQKDVARGDDVFEQSLPEGSLVHRLLRHCPGTEAGKVVDFRSLLKALPPWQGSSSQAPLIQVKKLNDTDRSDPIETLLTQQGITEDRNSKLLWTEALRMNTQNTDATLLEDLLKRHPRYSILLSHKHRIVFPSKGQAVSYFLAYPRLSPDDPRPNYLAPPTLLTKTSDCRTQASCRQFSYTLGGPSQPWPVFKTW